MTVSTGRVTIRAVRLRIRSLRLVVATALGTIVVGAVVLSAPVGAEREGKGTVKVPAPAIGKALVESLTVTVTAPKGGTAAPPRIRATNLPELGRGFGGVAVIRGPSKPGARAKYTIYFVMYMGNLSTAPASTVEIRLSSRAGKRTNEIATTKPADVSTACRNLEFFNDLFEHDVEVKKNGTIYLLSDYVPTNASAPERFLDGVNSLLWGLAHCPGEPEADDPGNT